MSCFRQTALQRSCLAEKIPGVLVTKPPTLNTFHTFPVEDLRLATHGVKRFESLMMMMMMMMSHEVSLVKGSLDAKVPSYEVLQMLRE